MKYKIDYNYGDMIGKRIKIDNCDSEFIAKCRLHDYLVRRHGEKELVITNCAIDCGADDIFGLFGDIF